MGRMAWSTQHTLPASSCGMFRVAGRDGTRLLRANLKSVARYTELKNRLTWLRQRSAAQIGLRFGVDGDRTCHPDVGRRIGAVE